MNVIGKLKLQNFKCFKDPSELNFSNYNLLCGTNGSGKSSIMQAILLLAQNNYIENKCILNGRIIKLGEFKEVKNFEKGQNENVRICSFNNDNEENSLKFNDEMELLDRKCQYDIAFDKNIFYLSANRIGAADTYEDAEDNIVFGKNGEYAISFLRQFADESLSNDYIFDKSIPSGFLYQVNYWLKKICDSEVQVKKIEQSTKVIASYKSFANYYVRNTNTGSGNSFVISLIIMCLGVALLGDSDNKMLLIENPEIHLHPKAQSILAEFLMFMSKKIQLVIETHSDHFFNAYRVALKQKNITIENSKVYFVKREKLSSIVKEIKFTDTGRILTKEKDLFDQFDIDLYKMI